MEVTTNAGDQIRTEAHRRRQSGFRRLRKEKYLWLLVLPGLIYFAVFKYLPMFGIVIAFKKYNPFTGIWKSPWAGFEYFQRMMDSPDVLRVLWNTLVLSFYQIAFVFFVPIVLALMINEIAYPGLKRLIQTVIYLPHFLSWVVVAGVFYLLFNSGGSVTSILAGLGYDNANVLTDPAMFRPLIILQSIWKEAGWGTILYLAALLGVDPELYEAAKIDGAGRFRQMWNISLPGIRSTVCILLILRMGSVLDVGFEQIFLMLNPQVSQVGEVIDTYVYFLGIRQGNFSFAAAVGLTKGIVGLFMIASANWLTRRLGEKGLF